MQRLLPFVLICIFLLTVSCQQADSPISTSANQDSTTRPEVESPTTSFSNNETAVSRDDSKLSDSAADSSQPPIPAGMPKTGEELKAMRSRLDETVWSNEVLAQKHERTFVELWDNLIHQPDAFQVLRDFRFEEFLVGSTEQSESLEWGIQRLNWNGPTQEIPFSEWARWLVKFEDLGYHIMET